MDGFGLGKGCKQPMQWQTAFALEKRAAGARWWSLAMDNGDPGPCSWFLLLWDDSVGVP